MSGRSTLIVFNPDKVDYRKLFLQQTGSGSITRFYGTPRQRGHGIGAVIAAIKHFLPIFLKSPIGQAATSLVTNVASDLIGGQPLKETVKTRGRETVKSMTGLGKRGKVIGYIHKPKRNHRIPPIPKSSGRVKL